MWSPGGGELLAILAMISPVLLLLVAALVIWRHFLRLVKACERIAAELEKMNEKSS